MPSTRDRPVNCATTSNNINPPCRSASTYIISTDYEQRIHTKSRRIARGGDTAGDELPLRPGHVRLGGRATVLCVVGFPDHPDPVEGKVQGRAAMAEVQELLD